MKKKTGVLATEDDLIVDLTFYKVPASLLTEFAEKFVGLYYSCNLNAAVQAFSAKPSEPCVVQDGSFRKNSPRILS